MQDGAPRVCNLYSVHTTQAMIRQAFDIARDNAGNCRPCRDFRPDGTGVRNVGVCRCAGASRAGERGVKRAIPFSRCTALTPDRFSEFI